MSEKEKKDSGAPLYRVDTVPPPAGQSDAYNAPTKVGPMPAATIAAMMQEAERQVAENNARAAKKVAASAKPIPREEPETPQKVAVAAAVPEAEIEAAPAPDPAAPQEPPAPEHIPKIYSEEDDEDKAATLLSPFAKPPPTPPTSSPHVDDVVAAVDEKNAPLAPPPMAALRPSTGWTSWAIVALIAVAAALAIWWLKHHGHG